jgi:hypothetical protein
MCFGLYGGTLKPVLEGVNVLEKWHTIRSYTQGLSNQLKHQGPSVAQVNDI